MKKWRILLILGVMLIPSLAHADVRAVDLRGLFRAMGGAVTVPPEWDGLWDTTDSTYDCEGALTIASSGVDTICAGQIYSPGSTDPTFTITCDGSVTATTLDVTCTGGGEVFKGCVVSEVIHILSTRTADTFHSEITINADYTGECKFSLCTRIVSDGVRTGPAPSAYCLTPARPTTWGQLKAHYR